MQHVHRVQRRSPYMQALLTGKPLHTDVKLDESRVHRRIRLPQWMREDLRMVQKKLVTPPQTLI